MSIAYENETLSLSLIAITVSSISITANPIKTAYKYGESINYLGLIVIAEYDDGSTADVTNSCSITPAAGKAFDPLTDTSISISYAGKTASITLTPITLTSISITSNPDRTEYAPGEAIDYAGLAVMATYSDGSMKDVTSSCSIIPTSGKAFDTDTNVIISYTENDITVTAGLTLTEIALTDLQITTAPIRTSYRAEEKISYEGLVVTASYSNGDTRIVTNDCLITPASGKAFDPNTDTIVEIRYGNASCTLTLTPVSLTAIQVTREPFTTEYFVGEAIHYDGVVISGLYSDGTTCDVTEGCSFSPEAGSIFNSETVVTITYFEQTCILTLTEAARYHAQSDQLRVF